MALTDKKKIFARKLIEVHRGTSDQSGNSVIRLTIISGAEKQHSITIGADRWEMLARELEAAAAALRGSFNAAAPAKASAGKPPVPKQDDAEIEWD